ncbi:hypothetical protein L1987_77064 [Smallanthus sonchifolius]|uniref:Uncharacterized protein n=1 Tax=Smallanthus sonchifolius TaxID=185202 RepID=A0ACB8Z9Z1_9ASTR|nr:hypothetical protein L1987_77064 [Smallanthus sonchifolius]
MVSVVVLVTVAVRRRLPRVPVEVDEDADCVETAAPKFDANEEKSFEIVQKMIEGCQVEKLKVDQCRLYLRRHGLRLTGKKDIRIQRIKIL